MKPIRPYPGHRGKRPVQSAQHPVGLLSVLSAYNDNLYRNTEYLSGNRANPYNQRLNAFLGSQVSEMADRPAPEKSQTPSLLVSTTPKGLPPHPEEVLSELRARLSKIRELTNPALDSERTGE